jgi:hypothetical protein
MSKKIKFVLSGIEFQLDEKFLKTKDYYGNPIKPTIKMNHVAAANVVKQYVKKKYPEVVVSAKSSSFSGGNSVDIYLSDKFGNGVDESIAKDVDRFGSQFEYGKFDGMTDMYEYTNDGVSSDNGTHIDAGVKYLHVSNRPQHGSVPSVVEMIRKMTTTTEYVFGKLSLEEAIKKAKYFGATDNNIGKALQLI